MMTFNPQTGKEQAGYRPALVLTSKTYNSLVGLMLCCPITSKKKGYAFEVELPQTLLIQGVILTDHVKSLDFHERKIKFVEKVPKEILDNVIANINVLLNE